MKILHVACLALLLVGGSAPRVRAETDAAPFEAIRTLETLQDRIATGDALAQVAYAKAIPRMGRAFARAKLSTWSDKRNARALIVYLFSGGNAQTVENAISQSAVAPGLGSLYAGAIAYGRGDDETARVLLMPIDVKTVPSGLGGHLALVQATLTARDDPAKAIALLDLARLLEPGTLVEEAALRKEMSLIGATGDLDKFSLLARRYIGAFAHSAYADNFRQLVAQTAMQLGAGDTQEAGGKLARLTAGLDRGERRRLYLAIAREALIAGRTTMAALVGEEARRLTWRNEPDEARALVYFGAATIVGVRYDLGVKALSGVTPDRLDKRDRALQSSALAVSEMIRKPFVVTQAEEERGTQAAISADVERALAAAEGLLKDARE